MNISHLLVLLRRRGQLGLATVVVVLAITTLATMLTPKTYRSSLEFFVSANAGQLASGNSFTQQRINTYAELIRTPRALDPVLRVTGAGTTHDLADQITASIPPGSVLLDITVTDQDPQRAVRVAEAIGDTFPGIVADLEEVNGTNPVKVTIVKEATEPVVVTPKPLRNVVLGLIVGAMLGLAVCVAADRLDRRIRDREDLQSLTPLSLLASIPVAASGHLARPGSRTGGDSGQGEAFRSLRARLTFSESTAGLDSLVVTSATIGEGSSTVAAHLAVAYARSGARICLVDADLRRPGLGATFGVEGRSGLSDVLAGRESLDSVVQATSEHGLDVVLAGSGSTSPSEVLSSSALAPVLAELAQRYDLVLIDAPPVLSVTDATVLSVHADGVLFVVGAELAEGPQVQDALASLTSVGGNVVGLVLNRARIGQTARY